MIPLAGSSYSAIFEYKSFKNKHLHEADTEKLLRNGSHQIILYLF